MRFIASWVSSALVSAFVLSAAWAAEPPVAKRIPHPVGHFGEVLTDDYFWLRDEPASGQPFRQDVVEQMTAENAYTDSVMAPLVGLKGTLFKELKGRAEAALNLEETDRLDGYEYYQRQEPGAQYKSYYRKKIGTEREELLLDGPKLAGDSVYFKLEIGNLSPDGKLLPYGIDTFGKRAYALYVKNLETGEVRKVREKDVKISGSYWQLAWSSDSRYLFYSVPGTLSRDSRVVRYDLAAASGTDAEVSVYDELDGDFYLLIRNTRSKKYIVLLSDGNGTSVARVISADRPLEAPVALSVKKPGFKYEVDHLGGRFYFRGNPTLLDYSIYTADERSPAVESWKPLLSTPVMTTVEAMSVFKDYIVAVGLKDAYQQVATVRLKDLSVRKVEFEHPFYAVDPGRNIDPASSKWVFTRMSYTEPSALMELDLKSGKLNTLKKITYENNPPSNYVVERIWTRASDGTMVPANLVAKKGYVRDGKTPLLLYAYGHYGSSGVNSWEFGKDRFTFLDRGVIYVQVFPRGGGEMGTQWGLDGKMGKKKNTFTDLISAAEHLVAQGYTSKDRMAYAGLSAAGLNCGYLTNNRPDLFKAVWAEVPFVDLINTMSDATIPLTTQEYVVWGNPGVEDEYLYMRSYSPYDNVGSHAYPAMIVTSAMGDSQVPYWEPAKWVARIRANKTDSNPLILRMGMVGGHGGGSGLDAPLEAEAEIQAFLLNQIGTR